MKRSPDLISEEKVEHHRSPIKENIRMVWDGQMDLS
jgi:hypothetical protein